MKHTIDKEFLELPYRELGQKALAEATRLGASYADFRFERVLTQNIVAHDHSIERSVGATSQGYGVRLLVDGVWGFASSIDCDDEQLLGTVASAVSSAQAIKLLEPERVDQAPEPSHQDDFVSEYEIDPFSVGDQEKAQFLLAVNAIALEGRLIDHIDFSYMGVREQKYFASTEGAMTTQQRVRLHANFDVTRLDPKGGGHDTMRSLSVPVGRGWEYMTSGYDYMAAAREIPQLLVDKMSSPSVEPGSYDLVIDPTNLWLTIHESIGHATELDRVLGYEANYAGTSFATLDKLGTLQYGSKVMNITGDRLTPHGLSTVGYDDEGVAAQSWDIVKDGVLVGYQTNRQMAKRLGLSRSNGCAFADSYGHVPIQRMPNVSLKPSPEAVSTQDLIARVKRGIYILGDKSWSIDMQRYNFQFTGQRFYEIRDGQIVGQLRDVAYQATTTDFWNSMEAVGGQETYLLGGAFNCGKGQPGQVAPVSHGAPSALFRGINVLNTTQEGAQ
jgi:TldD protein